MIENKDIHIFEMNKIYLQLVNFLDSTSEHIEEFLRGDFLPFGTDTCVHKDPIYQILVKPSEIDTHTTTAPKVLLPALASSFDTYLRTTYVVANMQM